MPISNSSLPYPIPPLFASQKLILGSSPKGLPELESTPTILSPTSTLETKHYFDHKWRRRSPTTGLGLVDILHDDDDDDDHDPKTNKKIFLFGSQLKIQLPSLQQPNNNSPPQSPIEFGIKTRDSQLKLSSGLRSPDIAVPTTVLASITPELLTDIELSEDYTCVISHGPNPKTTHIFDNCILQQESLTRR